MGRAKLRMELICHEKVRRKAFERKKTALERSARELSILCDVDVAMIVCDPFGGSNQPSVWPPEPEVVERLIESCNSRKDGVCGNKVYGLSDFFKDQTGKMEEETHSVCQKRIDSMPREELKHLFEFLNSRIYAAIERIEMSKASGASSPLAGGLMHFAVQESRDFYPEWWNMEPSEMVQLQPPILQHQPLPTINASNRNIDLMFENAVFISGMKMVQP